MKKAFLFLCAALLLLAFAACDAPVRSDPDDAPENLAPPSASTVIATPAVPTPEPGYIWTVSVDGRKAQVYGEGQLTANYTLHLSASKEGGNTPIGEYRGELQVEYEGVPDEATLFAIDLLGGTYDFEGWGKNDAFTFAMQPYDHKQMMAFVATAYQGEGARTAPLIDGIAMYTAEDIPFSDSDWGMGLDAGLDGIFGVDAVGDEAGASSSVYTPFGSGSAASDTPVKLRCSLHFLDENRVQFNIWSHGNLDVNLSFDGTLDKVALADTIPVE